MNGTRAGFPDERGVGGGEGAPAGVRQRRTRGGVLVAGHRAAPDPVVGAPALRRHSRRLQVQLRQYVLLCPLALVTPNLYIQIQYYILHLEVRKPVLKQKKSVSGHDSPVTTRSSHACS